MGRRVTCEGNYSYGGCYTCKSKGTHEEEKTKSCGDYKYREVTRACRWDTHGGGFTICCRLAYTHNSLLDLAVCQLYLNLSVHQLYPGLVSFHHRRLHHQPHHPHHHSLHYPLLLEPLQNKPTLNSQSQCSFSICSFSVLLNAVGQWGRRFWPTRNRERQRFHCACNGELPYLLVALSTDSQKRDRQGRKEGRCLLVLQQLRCRLVWQANIGACRYLLLLLYIRCWHVYHPEALDDCVFI